MKINIHNSTYIFILLCFLSGYFEYIFILLLTILIHEFGHYIFSLLIGIKTKEIVIYPLGGITILNSYLNTSIYKEFISLIGGIIFQLIFFLFIYILYKNNIITTHMYNLIYKINFILISFNFMIILPLDGGKLLNIILDKYICYINSIKITILISIIFSIIFLIYFHNIYSIIIFIFLIKGIIIEYKTINTKYILFLYERYTNNYKFKHIRYINNINYFYRDTYHYIKNINEDKILKNIFTR